MHFQHFIDIWTVEHISKTTLNYKKTTNQKCKTLSYIQKLINKDRRKLSRIIELLKVIVGHPQGWLHVSSLLYAFTIIPVPHLYLSIHLFIFSYVNLLIPDFINFNVGANFHFLSVPWFSLRQFWSKTFWHIYFFNSIYLNLKHIIRVRHM